MKKLPAILLIVTFLSLVVIIKILSIKFNFETTAKTTVGIIALVGYGLALYAIFMIGSNIFLACYGDRLKLAPLPYGMRSLAQFHTLNKISVRNLANQFCSAIYKQGELISRISSRPGKPGVSLALLEPTRNPAIRSAISFHVTFGRIKKTGAIEFELRSGYLFKKPSREAAQRALIACHETLQKMNVQNLRWSADHLFKVASLQPLDSQRIL